MMNKNRILGVLLALSVSVFAQYPAQMSLLNGVPQSKYYNAGHFPEYSGYFGMPLLSNITATASNSGFSFSDFFAGNALDLDGLVDGMDEKNYLNLGVSTDLLGFGFKVKKNYFSLNVTAKSDFNFGYNKNLIGFLVKGNGPSIGQTLNFDGTGFDFSAYGEIGLGYTREIDEKLSVGGRLKFLVGLANISGDFDGIGLYTDPDDYSLTATSTFSINQFGAHLMNDSLRDAWNAPYFNPSNFGFGVDFGGSYKFSDQLTLFASVVDLGYISWKDYGETWSNDGASFTFDGLPMDEIMGSGDDQSNNDPNEEENDFFTNLTDSASETFALTKTRGDYQTSLKTKMFLGANYQMNKYFTFDGLLYGRVYNSTFYPSAMVGVDLSLGKWFTLKGTYAMTNKTYDNIGLGAVLNLGALQVYASMDNLYGLTQVDYARHMAGSFGINFVFNSKDKKKAKKSPKIENKKGKESSEQSKPESKIVLIDTVPEPKVDSLTEPTPVVAVDSIVKPLVDSVKTVTAKTDSNSVTQPILNDSDAVAEKVDSAAGSIALKQDSSVAPLPKQVVEQKVTEEVKEVEETKQVVEEKVTEEVKEVEETKVEEAMKSSTKADVVLPPLQEKSDSLVVPVKAAMDSVQTAPSSNEPTLVDSAVVDEPVKSIPVDSVSTGSIEIPAEIKMNEVEINEPDSVLINQE